MERFFESHFGDILLSGVQVNFTGDTQAYGETQRAFPVLADGSGTCGFLRRFGLGRALNRQVQWKSILFIGHGR